MSVSGEETIIETDNGFAPEWKPIAIRERGV